MVRRLLAALALVTVAMTVGIDPPLGAREGGEVTGEQGAPSYGSTRAQEVAGRMVALAATPTGLGYWQVADNGDVYPFGDARFAGSPGGAALNRPIVGMAPSPTGLGYWLAASDGGIFSYGDAGFHGSTGAMPLNQPIVGMAPTPSGRGYWLVASDGGIFSFGDAGFFGSTGGMRLQRPIVGMAPTPSGRGYWLVASDGGIFSFGDAGFFGSGGAAGIEDAVALAPTVTGAGYWLATATGRVLAFGDAPDPGLPGGGCRDQPVVALATRRSGGFWLGSGPFPPATIGSRAHPLDAIAAESANIALVLRVRQGCQPNAVPTRGRLSSPLPGNRTTSSFGTRTHPVFGRSQFHTGDDLAGGSAILAPADGTVVQVADRFGYGLTTVVDHGDGVGTVFAHQAAVDVRPGDRVTRGQQIGTVGRSGTANGNNLHFEVRVHGVPTDPTAWL